MINASLRSPIGHLTTRTSAGLTISAALLLLAAAPAGAANIVLNGSFEQPPNPLNANNDDSLAPFGTGFLVGSTGWSVTANAVELIRHYFQPTDGLQTIDLDEGALPSDNRGAIEQALTTVPGGVYLLTFDLAGNFQGNPELGGTADPIKRLGISWGGANLDHVTFDSTGRSTNNMGWVHYSYTVTALSASTFLGFASETIDPHSSYGPILDNVSVEAVPTPSGAALAVSGLATLGLRRRRKH